DIELVLDLIYNEIVQRQRRGEHPQPDEYLRRFPQYATQLRVQFEVHSALEADTGLAPEGRWFVARGREKIGPLVAEQLRALAQAGKLSAQDMVLPEGTAKWIPARDIPGLFPPAAPSTLGGEQASSSSQNTALVFPQTLAPSGPDESRSGGS